MQLSEAAKNLKPGTYEHFKGKRYEVIGVAHHSETLEEMVVYRALYGDGPSTGSGRGGLWIRPLAMFTEIVECDGHPSTEAQGGSEHSRTSQKFPRFKFIGY